MMTDPDNINTKATDTEADSLIRQQADAQQVSIKAWTQKLLVVLLCIASFYGGWKSYESYMVNECAIHGGQMVEGQRTLLCQLP